MEGSIVLLCLVFWPMAGALLSYLIGRKNKTIRDLFADFVVILECLIMVILLVQKFREPDPLVFSWDEFCMMGIHLELDGFRLLYGFIAAFMWTMTTVFSREYFRHHRNRNRYYLFTLLTFGATMGVFLSADLFTTFIFFEIMSLTSYEWVAQEENISALRAAGTYMGVAIIGGLVMLMGLFLLYDATGTLTLSQMGDAISNAVKAGSLTVSRQYLIGGLLVFGFGAKAGMFPLHIWLPAAHPVAPAPASALLSGILTKSGIFGILAVTCNLFRYQPYWGYVIVILGTLTMFLGALLALFSVDLKRVLACSSMSQIGFILIGTGMISLLGEEAALAARGTLLHMVNHSLIKLVLFMIAGVVFMNTHKLNLNEIRGFGRKKPLLCATFLMGALGIGGIPLWNGYVSKTLLHESILEYAGLFQVSSADSLIGTYTFWKCIEWIFLISGGMTVAYMMKLFVALFVEKNTDPALQRKYDRNTSYWNPESKIAILVSAVLLPVMGFFPNLVMDPLANLGVGFMNSQVPAEKVAYFSASNLEGAFSSILMGLLIYFIFVRKILMIKDKDDPKALPIYVDRWPVWMNLENVVYRPVLLMILPGFFGILCRFLDSFLDLWIVLLRKTLYRQTGKKGKIFNANFKAKMAVTGLAEKMYAGSLSFGLFLVSIGILVVLVVLFLYG